MRRSLTKAATGLLRLRQPKTHSLMASRVSNIPATPVVHGQGTELPLSGEKLKVAQLTASDHQAAFSLVCDAARRADNIGVDEFPTLQHLQRLLASAPVALGLQTDSSAATDKLDGLIVISPCRYARSSRPTVCTALLVTCEQLSRRLVWRDLVSVALDAARQPPNTFSACVVDVFITNLDRVTALREQGFFITACIPNAGRLASTRGYTANYVMYKALAPAPEKLLEVPATTNSATPGDDVRQSTDFQQTLLPIVNLPISFTLSDGTKLVTRCMRRDEIRSFYEAIMWTASVGRGYGADEIPNYDYFVRYYVHNCQNSVTVLADTGEVVSYENVGPSCFSRSAEPAICDGGNLVMMQKFQGRKWYLQICNATYSAHEISSRGLMGFQGDTAITNVPAVLVGLQLGYTVNGVLPRGIYFKDKGWTDMLLYYAPTLGIPNGSLLSKM